MDEKEVSTDSTPASEGPIQNQMGDSSVSPEHQFRQVGDYGSSMEMNKKGDSKALLLILGLIVLVVIGVTGFLLREKFTKSLQSEPSPSPAMAEESSPMPSPSPEFDRSKFTLRVLNGTKTSGLAASVSAKLKDLGYSIDKSGNATNSAFLQTLVRVKTSGTDLANQLITDLAPDYTASVGASLKDSDTDDAEIIIGAK